MSDTQIPRRIDFLRWTEAERAISYASELVEAMGADVLLTDAVVLLTNARGKVADYVDSGKYAGDQHEPSEPEIPR